VDGKKRKTFSYARNFDAVKGMELWNRTDDAGKRKKEERLKVCCKVEKLLKMSINKLGVDR
jgi:hypothetical protein